MSAKANAAAMQELLDKTEIGELQSRYMYALDWRDAEMYSSLFTEDAILEWPEGRAEGRKAIHEACIRIGAFFKKLAVAAEPRKPAALRHFVMNRVFDIKGDKARAWAYWFDTNNDNLQRWPYLAAYGMYEDDLVRTADGWKFTHRKVINDISGDSPKENPLRNLLSGD